MDFLFSAQYVHSLNLHICFVKYSLEIARSKLFKNKIDSRVYFERDEWDYEKVELREKKNF